MMIFVYFSVLLSAVFVASLIAVSSAVNTLCVVSGPRYCCWVAEVVGLYIAAPMCPSIPDPSVYMHMV